MKKCISSFWVILFFLNAGGQNLTGIWKGTLTQGPGGCFPVYNIELQILVEGTKVTGASYHYSDLENYVKEQFEGSYNPDTKTLSISEIKLTTYHVPSDCVPCIKKYTLTYSKNGDKEVLSGDWGGVTMNNSAACPPGTIGLNRTEESAFKEVDKTIPLTMRVNELVKEIKVDTGMINISFYDNATVDGDTISVFLDKEVVLSNQRLTTQPIKLNIMIDLLRQQHEVVMVAENMGEIPPNTALMVIDAGKERYRLFLTSTEQKNAMVRFIYEKPPGH